MDQETQKAIDTLRAVTPALNPGMLLSFRNMLAARHNDLDAFVVSKGFGEVSFFERELVRTQLDSIRALLDAAGIQAEYIEQTTPKAQAPQAQAPQAQAPQAQAPQA